MGGYKILENIGREHQGEVCIFGAGLLGRKDAYELLKCAEIGIDFYCDNYMMPGTIIQDGLRIRPLEYLYENKDHILVFVCMAYKYQIEVMKQLEMRGVRNVIAIDLTFISQILESIEQADDVIKQKYHIIYDDAEYLKRKFKRRVGYDLNLENPKTFNEKLQWLKLNDRNPEYTKLVDKYEFKKHIEVTLGKEYVIPILKVWDAVEDIEWNKLPEQFVLKCTHDCGSVVFCRDKSSFNVEESSEKLKKALSRNYYWACREWPYKNVKPRIMMEPYLEDPSGEIIDYKFLCYGGKCRYIFTCTERYGEDGLKVTFFNRDWEKLSIKRHYAISKQNIRKPINLEKMIEIAEKLSGDYPFVRIDLYEINGKIYVGEFTLYPGAGFEEFDDYEDDILLGQDIICGEQL